ncbi:protein kinase domain-containing protein [Nocardia sp. CA-136227]|uniref:serine/threonine-protein kinase n=1 Tax=Nocardia sp. CA-136227 TaxID=3239979 RepID=UPI003D99004A
MVEPGENFAGYVIERELGRGGMGAVYLARHPRLPRWIALKLLNAEYHGDSETHARFEREADLAARLNHPGVVTVYDRGVEDGRLWIAMQYVDGIEAESVTDMTAERAVEIVAATADALDYAHRVGVLHRDVKPANIMLARETREQQAGVLLTDFGIARLQEDTGRLTGSGSVMATLAYASPEQLQNQPVDHRADQYSLACTLFRLLTGVPLFRANDLGAIVKAHLYDNPPPIASLRPDLPATLDPVLARALAKNPDDRYPTCSDFAAAAQRALAEGTAVESSHAPPRRGGADPSARRTATPSTGRRGTRNTSGSRAAQADSAAGRWQQSDPSAVRRGQQSTTPPPWPGQQSDSSGTRRGQQSNTAPPRPGQQSDTSGMRRVQQPDTPAVWPGQQSEASGARRGSQPDSSARRRHPSETTGARRVHPSETTGARRVHPSETTGARRVHPSEITGARRAHQPDATGARRTSPSETTGARRIPQSAAVRSGRLTDIPALSGPRTDRHQSPPPRMTAPGTGRWLGGLRMLVVMSVGLAVALGVVVFVMSPSGRGAKPKAAAAEIAQISAAFPGLVPRSPELGSGFNSASCRVVDHDTKDFLPPFAFEGWAAAWDCQYSADHEVREYIVFAYDSAAVARSAARRIRPAGSALEDLTFKEFCGAKQYVNHRFDATPDVPSTVFATSFFDDPKRDKFLMYTRGIPTTPTGVIDWWKSLPLTQS